MGGEGAGTGRCYGQKTAARRRGRGKQVGGRGSFRQPPRLLVQRGLLSLGGPFISLFFSLHAPSAARRGSAASSRAHWPLQPDPGRRSLSPPPHNSGSAGSGRVGLAVGDEMGSCTYGLIKGGGMSFTDLTCGGVFEHEHFRPGLGGCTYGLYSHPADLLGEDALATSSVIAPVAAAKAVTVDPVDVKGGADGPDRERHGAGGRRRRDLAAAVGERRWAKRGGAHAPHTSLGSPPMRHPTAARANMGSGSRALPFPTHCLAHGGATRC